MTRPRPPVFTAITLPEALASSRDTGRLVLLDATASWCQPCQTMDRVTWVAPKLVAWLEEHAVALQVDVDAEKELAASLSIRSMPTVIVFRAGAELDRVVGMRGPDDLLAWLQAAQRGETTVDKLRRRVARDANDMQSRYALARGLAIAGLLAEATGELVWLWQHVLEHSPSMVGVRGSYMLREIATLVEGHPPARVRFTELRTALGGDGMGHDAKLEAMTDWMDLTMTLFDSRVLLDWFGRHRDALVARALTEHPLHQRLVRLLTEHGRWADVAQLYPDPAAALRQAHGQLEAIHHKDFPAALLPMRPGMVEGLEGLLRRQGAEITVSLLAARRDDEARAIAAEVRRLLPGKKTDEALAKSARAAGVEPP